MAVANREAVSPRLSPAAAKRGNQAAKYVDSSAAVLDIGLEDLSPLRLWFRAMGKYNVLQQLQESFEQAGRAGDGAAQAQALRDEAVALAEAMHALRGVGASQPRKKKN